MSNKSNEIIWKNLPIQFIIGESSDSVVECLTRDRGVGGSSLTGVTALWSLRMNINPSLVLIQPKKTRPYITERLLMGRKESNQTNKQKNQFKPSIPPADKDIAV